MSDKYEDPRQLVPQSANLKFSIDKKALLLTILKVSYDIGIGKLSQSTIPDLLKVFKIELDSKEAQALNLIYRSLSTTVNKQIKDRISQKQIDKNKDLVHDKQYLRDETLKGIENNRYSLHINDLANPNGIDLINDYIDFYKEWLKESFDLDEQRQIEFAKDFRDMFAYEFVLELYTNRAKYQKLLDWANNPQLEQLVKTKERINYRAELRQKYHAAALGQKNVMLSDVYVPLNFEIYHKQDNLSAEQRKELTKEQVFRPADYPKTIHDWFVEHFMTGKAANKVDLCSEDKRLLILLGQPGHGKSSFCYRSINDLLNNPHFAGEVFFVKLNNVDKNFLNEPLLYAKTGSSYQPNINDIAKTSKQPLVLFFDGLDEMYMTQSLSDREIRQFLDKCKSLTKDYKNLYIICTSRFNYVSSNELYETGGIVLALSHLNIKQQQYIIDQFKAKKGLDTCNIQPDLLKKINQDYKMKPIKELIALPILLQMILISEIELTEKSSRVQVYDKLFAHVIKRSWSEDKKLKKIKHNATVKDLRDYIAFLAYKIFISRNNYLHRYQIEEEQKTKVFKKRYLQKTLGENDDIKIVLKDILTSFYLKETIHGDKQDEKASEEDYALEFLHKSLYEYLACEHIWNELVKKFLVEEYIFEERRREDLLKEMQDLFSHFEFTQETGEYMVGIINRKTSKKHSSSAERLGEEKYSLLVERLGKHFPYFIEQGFLYRYDIPNSGKPQYTAGQQAINTFYGYWLVFSNLVQADLDENTWSDFQTKRLPTLDRETMISAYSAYIAKDKKRKIDYPASKQYREWLNNIDTRPIYNVFMIFTRNFAFQQQKNYKQISKLNETINVIKQELASFIRKTNAQRLPAALNYTAINLSEMDLRGMLLNNTSFRSADLSSADLSSADLSSADLSSADLRSADLSSADLSYADLSYVIVDSPNWFDRLEEWKVEGLKVIKQKYRIEQEEKEHKFFGRRLRIVVKGYKILPQ